MSTTPLSASQEQGTNFKFIVYVIAVIAALSGLLFGLDVGVISGALSFLKPDFGLSDGQQEMIVSAVLIGAVIGTLLSGFISNRFGRRITMLLSAVIFTVGALLSAAATSVTWLVSVRVFLGIAVGMASFTAPLYLSEISPKKIRGALIAMYQLMVTIGLLLAFFSDTLFGYIHSWRWMLGVPAIPAIVMLIGIYFLPRSPRWLMLKQSEDSAREVLRTVYQNEEEMETEIREIKRNLENTHSNWRHVFKQPYFVSVAFLGIFLQMTQQFTGMNTIMYYAPQVFKLAGFASHSQQMWCTVLVGVVNVATTLLAIRYVDRFGRRPILFFGLVLQAIGMGALSYNFHLAVMTNFLSWVTVVAVLVFIFGFAISLGPIIWIVCAEIYPLRDRDVGLTISTATNWICNAIIGGTFLTFIHYLRPSGTFLMFAIICVLSFIYIYFYCPETKNVSLEKIEQNLLEGKRTRHIGDH